MTTSTTPVSQTRERLAKLLEQLRKCLSFAKTVNVLEGVDGATPIDDLVDIAIGIDFAEEGLEALSKMIGSQKKATFAFSADRFIDTGTGAITRHGKTVYVATEYWPGPKFRDLLPTGVDPDDDQYKDTVARCRVAAKDRLIASLQSDPNFSGLVELNYNSNSLRSALTGKDVERNDADEPILPESVKDVVDLNPRNALRVIKAARK